MAAFHGILDEEGWLLGRDAVCPAPPDILARTWAALDSYAAPDPDPADVTPLWISGLWAVLGATRRLRRDGCPDLDAPARVLELLAAGGPGALVREVPIFEPRWALHVWEHPPESLLELVVASEGATQLADLDAAWTTFLDGSRQRRGPLRESNQAQEKSMRPYDVRGPTPMSAPGLATAASTVITAILAVWFVPPDLLPMALVALATLAAWFVAFSKMLDGA